MKKYSIISVTIIISVFLFSCKGLKGPAGPAGDAPASGWKVATYQYGVNGFLGYNDTAISEDDPAGVYGLDTYLYDGIYTNKKQHIMIKFTLPDLPAGAVIKKSTISLKRTSDSYFVSANTLTFYEVMEQWNEGQTTWNTALTGIPWATSPGGAGSIAISNPVSITGPADNFVTWSLDVNWVKKCYGTPATYGIILKDNAVSGTKDFSFYTREYSAASDRPIITIYYAIE